MSPPTTAIWIIATLRHGIVGVDDPKVLSLPILMLVLLLVLALLLLLLVQFGIRILIATEDVNCGGILGIGIQLHVSFKDGPAAQVRWQLDGGHLPSKWWRATAQVRWAGHRRRRRRW